MIVIVSVILSKTAYTTCHLSMFKSVSIVQAVSCPVSDALHIEKHDDAVVHDDNQVDPLQDDDITARNSLVFSEQRLLSLSVSSDVGANWLSLVAAMAVHL